MPSATIRDFRPGDATDLYEVCLRTGDSGKDATGLISQERLLGDVYVGPYLELAPELALVADDGVRAAGYALAVLDTRKFEAECQQVWWPQLRARYLNPVPDSTSGIIEAELLAIVKDPALARHPELPGYPSHLHIDLLPHIRGGGIGSRMLTTLFARLRAAGSVGVHLGVATSNSAAQRFYDRLGFVDLIRAGDELYMGLSWEAGS